MEESKLESTPASFKQEIKLSELCEVQQEESQIQSDSEVKKSLRQTDTELIKRRSPFLRFLDLLGSPGRLIYEMLKPGSVKSSVFSLVTICLGASTITIPYVFYELGFVFGTFSILFGGGICMFASQLITHCS